MTKFKRIQLGVITSAKNTATKLIKIKEELEGINKMVIDKDTEIKQLKEEIEKKDKEINKLKEEMLEKINKLKKNKEQ